MIESWADPGTYDFWAGKKTARARRIPADVQERARKKLAALNVAISIDALRMPPSNHLEALKGDRAGQHSIRITGQWRICFVWKDGNPHDVEIVDYHV